MSRNALSTLSKNAVSTKSIIVSILWHKRRREVKLIHLLRLIVFSTNEIEIFPIVYFYADVEKIDTFANLIYEL